MRGRRALVSPGQRFDRLLVLTETPERDNGERVYRCWCDCGRMTKVRGGHLRRRRIRSCGCLLCEVAAARLGAQNRTHGQVGSPEHQSWRSMKQRCLNPNAYCYKDYGGRGIRIHRPWMTFEPFLADMGERPEGKTLDRIDPNGDYEPSNCRWATPKEQQANRRDRQEQMA